MIRVLEPHWVDPPGDQRLFQNVAGLRIQRVHGLAHALCVLDQVVAQIARDGIAGFVLLVLAGRLIVLSASDFGELLGWDIFVVGAILVAVATSVPELATVVVARLRGHDEISVGTVLGSNIFNGLLIIGVAAVLTPIEVAGSAVRIAIAAGVVTMLLAIPGRSNRLPPVRGVLLLTVCAVYFGAVVLTHGG